MKKYELEIMRQKLESVGTYTGMKFRYAYYKNMEAIKKEISDMQAKLADILKPEEGWDPIQKKLNELNLQFAKKIEGTDKPVIQNNSFVIEDFDSYNKAIEAFKHETPEIEAIFAHRENQIKSMGEEQNKEIESEFHKLKNEDFPAEMKAHEFAMLGFMLGD